MKRFAVPFALAAALTSASAAKGAEPIACPGPDGAWLRLEIAGPRVAATLATSVADRLEAELRRWNIAVCTRSVGSDAPAPLANIALEVEDDDMLAITIVDRATDKRLERSISLRGIPDDARPLSIALAAEELLHASWFEALVDRARGAPSPPPAPASAVVETIAVDSLSARARAPRDVGGALAFVLAGEQTTGGQSLGGFDARAAYGGIVRTEVRLGYRLGAITAADHGDVESSAFVGGLSVAAGSPRTSRWGAEIFARADAFRIAFSGRASSAAVASSGAEVGLLAGGGVSGWRSLDAAGGWRLLAEVSLGAPLRAVAAREDGHTVTAFSGAVVGLAFGVGAAL